MLILGPSPPEFRQMSRDIQNAADRTVRTPGLLGIDPQFPRKVVPQLTALSDRLRGHVREEAGGGKNIDEVQSGIVDTVTALNGIVLATRQARPRMRGRQQAVVAHNSYEVLRAYAVDQTLSTTDYDFGDGLYPLDAYVDPDKLEYVDEPPSVRLRGDVVLAPDAKMDCPAFVGPPGLMPRLPRQLWHGVIGIYEGCGQFDQRVFPVDATSQNLSAWQRACQAVVARSF